MRGKLGWLASLLLVVTVSHASTWGENLRIDTRGLEESIMTLPDGRQFLAIDDMLIAIDPQTRSAFCCTQWPNATVFYQFDANVDANDGRPLSGNGAARRAAWRAAAQEWADNVPGLCFVEGMGDGNFIRVQSSAVNNSMLGMTGGSQVMNIINWDIQHIMAHEIGHAMGLLHEQTRTDRDTFVTVHLENILDLSESNYQIFPGQTTVGDYDYGSVMHYGRCFFWDGAMGVCGVDGHTMDAVPAGAMSVGLTEAQANAAMGQRTQLSASDIAGVRALSLVTVLGVVIDRTGSMNVGGPPDRCEFAEIRATLRIQKFAAIHPKGLVAAWTFQGGSVTPITNGFVTAADALTAVAAIGNCNDATPLADALCVAIDALAAASPGLRQLAFFTDGDENNSSGACSGPDSVSAMPPYDVGSWHRRVRDRALAANIQVEVDFYGATVRSAVDVETGQTRNSRLVPDVDYFQELASVTGGSFMFFGDDDLSSVPALDQVGLILLIMGLMVMMVLAGKRARQNKER